MTEWIAITDRESIAPGRLASFDVRGERILIYRCGNDYYAYPDRCTHEDVPLSRGFLVKGAVVCPLHGAKFDLKTGVCLRAPGSDLSRYEVAVRGDMLYVNLSDCSQVAKCAGEPCGQSVNGTS